MNIYFLHNIEIKNWFELPHPARYLGVFMLTTNLSIELRTTGKFEMESAINRNCFFKIDRKFIEIFEIIILKSNRAD